jgi:hypothetical protein
MLVASLWAQMVVVVVEKISWRHLVQGESGRPNGTRSDALGLERFLSPMPRHGRANRYAPSSRRIGRTDKQAVEFVEICFLSV